MRKRLITELNDIRQRKNNIGHLRSNNERLEERTKTPNKSVQQSREKVVVGWEDDKGGLVVEEKQLME